MTDDAATAHAPSCSFRRFRATDTEACLAIFDRNCPAFFAPNERADYAAFLANVPEGYEVCSVGDRLVGAFGLLTTDRASIPPWERAMPAIVIPVGAARVRITWILLDPDTQGTGLGAAMMKRAIEGARRAGATQMDIAASHLSEGFFATFNATTVSRQIGRAHV